MLWRRRLVVERVVRVGARNCSGWQEPAEGRGWRKGGGLGVFLADRRRSMRAACEGNDAKFRTFFLEMKKSGNNLNDDTR